MPKFSKKDPSGTWYDTAICPSCGERKSTDFTPEELKERDWECADCEEKRFNGQTPTSHGSKAITPYDPEFEFLTKLITLVTKQGIPVEEIKALTDKYRPLTTIDQAGDLAAEIWTLATTKYGIPREWLIKKLPERKASLAKKADAYNNPQDQWPAQEQAEDFSDRPVNSYAYEPEKVSGKKKGLTFDDVIRRLEARDPKPAHIDYTNHIIEFTDGSKMTFDDATKKALEIPKEGDAGNPDAGTGFYDTPGGADLGKRPEGDFPSSSWMPSGTADMDAEYWDNIASALSKKDLVKKALSKKELSKIALEVAPRNALPLIELKITYNDDEAERMNGVIAAMEKARSAAALDDLPFDIENIYKTHGNELWLDVYASSVNEAVDKITSFFQSAFGQGQQLASKRISLRKQANPDSRYWIAPDGKEFPVAGVHGSWIKLNPKILIKYGIKSSGKELYQIQREMEEKGWTRISNEPAGTGFQIEVADLYNLPKYLDNFIAQHYTNGDKILIGEENGEGFEITDPFPTIQKAVNKQLMRTRASLKKADLTGRTVNDILMQIESTGGATYNMSRGNLAGQEMFAVSIYPERERTEEIATFDDIENYIEANMDLLNDPSNSFGAWAHDGKVYFDVIATIPDQKQALELGRKHNQLAIYDLKNKVEIPTGIKRASLQKLAIARQDVVDFYLLSLIPLEALAEEGTEQHYNGLALFNGIVERLRNEYIEKGMDELRDEANTTQWVKRIPNYKMPEQLKPYYTFNESGYSSPEHSDESSRFPYQCDSCHQGLTEDDMFYYRDNHYCDQCEADAVREDLLEHVWFCTTDHKFVGDSEYADELENFVPSNKIDNIEDHRGHNLITFAEGEPMWDEIQQNLTKQLKLRFPRPEKKREPPTSAAFPEASLKTAGEGQYIGDGSYWQAPSNFDEYTASDFYNVFEYAPWKTSYGGPLWAEVAKTIDKMQKTTDLSSLIVLIDHFHDLGHNTGKLLDKFEEWYWLKPLLDLKAKPGSLRQLLGMASKPVRTVVTEYYRMHGKPDAMAAAIREVPFRLSKKAEDASPLTQEQQDQIAASSSPVYNIAINNFYEAAKRGHSKDRSLAYAVDSVKNLEKIDPKKLTELINTYLTGLI